MHFTRPRRFNTLAIAVTITGTLAAGVWADYTRNILLTGYWPPTNEMIRSFSTNVTQNPGGWIGGDWEHRGYDIFSYFPEFPNGLNQGEGDFMVDYQATSADFWRVTAELKPIAIIGFGRAADNRYWQLEGGARTWASTQWLADYVDPKRPDPNLPEYYETPGRIRYTSLPRNDIAAAVNASGANVTVRQTSYDGSRFLCNFIGYDDNWYHDLHADPNDAAWNIASGFIHVGGLVTVNDGRIATEATLRALTTYLDTIIPEPAAGVTVLLLAALAVRRRR